MITSIAVILLLTQTVAPEVRTAAESVFKSAKASAATHKVAGVYERAVFVDEFAHVAVAEDLQIAFERYGNGGLVEANSGTLKVDGFNLDVAWRYPEEYPNHPTIKKELLMIQWGEALILVPRARIHRFCINARENSAMIFDLYFVRKPTNLKELVGRPALPEAYRMLADLPEITAKAVRVEKQSFKKTDNDEQVAEHVVTLNRGLADHVFVGMEFDCEKTGRKYLVTSIENRTCEAKSVMTVKTEAAAPISRQGQTFRTSWN